MPNLDFDDFFLKEYDRISEAYFKIVASVSEFMKHYLTIVSVPPALLVIFGKPEAVGPVLELMRRHPFVSCLPFFVVSLVGFFLCRYLIALALNAHLYARTVNGIRAHFVAKVKATELAEVRRRIVLPEDTTKPSFKSGTINQ